MKNITNKLLLFFVLMIGTSILPRPFDGGTGTRISRGYNTSRPRYRGNRFNRHYHNDGYIYDDGLYVGEGLLGAAVLGTALADDYDY